MKHYVLALPLALMVCPLSAATVTTGFDLLITNGSGPPGQAADQTGETYSGSITFDDADLVANSTGGFTLDGNSADYTFDLTFVGRSFDQDGLGLPLVAELDAANTVIGLDIFIDIGNDFFFSAQGAVFSYDFSELVLNEGDPDDPDDDFEEQVTLASGQGVLLTGAEPEVIPLPATGWLVLVGLAGLAGLRKVRG